MSRVYFHSPDDESKVRGSERHHFGGIAHDMLMAAIGPIFDYEDNKHWTRKLFEPGHYLQTTQSAMYERSLSTALNVGHDKLTVGTDAFTLALNTMLAVGNDPMRLAARIHGQSEIHCWAYGKDRAWLADIIEQGRACGLYRADAKWEDVIKHLQADSSEPVVLSYSVCDQFPNRGVANYHVEIEDEDDDSDHDESWYALPESQRWAMAFSEIEKDKGLQLNPDHWKWPEFFFNPKINGFDLQGLIVK